MFEALEVALEMVEEVGGLVARIEDRDLVGQVRRAASSVALNLAEGGRRRGRDRAHAFRIAAGSADEVRAALRVAAAWRYVARADIERSLVLLDRIGAMTYRLSH